MLWVGSFEPLGVPADLDLVWDSDWLPLGSGENVSFVRETVTEADSIEVFSSVADAVFEKDRISELVAEIEGVAEGVCDAVGPDLLRVPSGVNEKEGVNGTTMVSVGDKDSDLHKVPEDVAVTVSLCNVGLRESVLDAVGDKDFRSLGVTDFESLPERDEDTVRCSDRVAERDCETEPADTVV